VCEPEDAFAGVGGVDLRRFLGADVDEHGLVSGLADPVSDERMFVSFCVESSENGDGSHGGMNLVGLVGVRGSWIWCGSGYGPCFGYGGAGIRQSGGESRVARKII